MEQMVLDRQRRGLILCIDMKLKAFTFIELIVYIAITSLLFTILAPLTIQIMDIRSRNDNMNDINAESQSMMKIMKDTITYSGGIDLANSDLNQNLAINSSYKLQLLQVGSTATTRISVSNGIVQMASGSQNAKNIHGNKLYITNLTFNNRSSSDGKSSNLEILLDLKINSSGSHPSYQDSSSIKSAVEVRLN